MWILHSDKWSKRSATGGEVQQVDNATQQVDIVVRQVDIAL